MIKKPSVLLSALIFIALSCPFSYADQLSSKKESGSVFKEALNDLDVLNGDRDGFMIVANQPATDEQPADRSSAEESSPVGRSKSSTDKTDKNEKGRGGYNIHPFISFSEYYTDNLFNTRDDKKSDFFTVLSPGVWLGFPWVKEAMPLTKTDTGSPGGLSQS